MTCEVVRILYLPFEVETDGHVGDTLLDAALDSGLNIQHECGGNCACTTCQVSIELGSDLLTPMEEVERDRLSTAESWGPNSRLACQAILVSGKIGEIVAIVVESLE